ncbi:MAG: TRAP transporter small permease [Alphaproteobacteria bacterium]|nr:TRAP transporter small permease [Alphaproteobacteria bacterium]
MADAEAPEGKLLFHQHPIDRWGRIIIQTFCGAMLILMMAFTNYTVVMRYVFLNPPFWADTVALFANIWLVFTAVAISIRARTQIAMTALYEYLPKGCGFWLEVVWSACTVLFGVFLFFVGGMAALDTPGEFWELNQLPKRYPLMILPVAGVLITLSSLSVAIEDIVRWRKGDTSVLGGFGTDGTVSSGSG